MEKILTMLFTKVLNMSVIAGYCILAVFLLRLLFRKAPRKYLYVLWLAVAFRLACPVSVSTEFSLFNLETFSGRARVTQGGAMEYFSVLSEGTGVFREDLMMGGSPDPGAEYLSEDQKGYPVSGDSPAGSVRSGQNGSEGMEVFGQAGASGTAESSGMPAGFGRIVSSDNMENRSFYMDTLSPWMTRFLDTGKYVWLTGIFLFLIYFAGSSWRLRYRVRMAVRVERVPSGKSGGRKNRSCAEVYECDDLPSPFVTGILHPRIYLSCGLQGEQRELVLLHEQYHIRRGDHLVKLLAFALLAVYWFHPLVWAAWRGMCRDMEMSCDEKVLEQLTDQSRKTYGMTLLSFASGSHGAGWMSPAFGEYDVKQRIRHVMGFKKPAVWAGALAVILIAAVMILLGTNGRGQDTDASESAETENTEETAAMIEEKLYKARNPYVGDPSANGRLLGAIAEALPDSMAADAVFTTRLQTSQEPYEFHFMLEEETEIQEAFRQMYAPSVLMLALTDNLGVVQWYGAAEEDESRELLATLDVQGAEKLCEAEDLKAYGGSPEKIRELLDLLEQRQAEELTTGELTVQESEPDTDEPLFSEDSDEFMDWYSCIPYEAYENAVPAKELDYEPGYEGDPIMAVLAQTEDGSVTLYGYCSKRRYGIRGMTIDYRTAPDGDSNHTYVYGELIWSSVMANVELYQADYDRDGRDEIALAVLDGTGSGRWEELMVFETWDTGHLEASVYTREMYEADILELVSASVDEENRMVQVAETGSESSVPLLSIPFEEEEKIWDIDLNSYVHFCVGEELLLESRVGLNIENFPGTWYGRAGGEDGTLRFRVIYDESRSLGGGYFTLMVQREEETGEER